MSIVEGKYKKTCGKFEDIFVDYFESFYKQILYKLFLVITHENQKFNTLSDHKFSSNFTLITLLKRIS
jgi:hypothetical protein